VIVYEALRGEFTEDVFSNAIEQRILAAYQLKTGASTSKAEVESWKNSMQYMNNALHSAAIPADAGVAIEFTIPQSSKRIDFLLTGRDAQDRDRGNCRTQAVVRRASD
jgi:hypothetical protein